MAHKYRYKPKSKMKVNYKIIIPLIALVLVVAAIGLNAKVEVPSGATPYCGDGICQSAESCSTCAADCGTCPTPPVQLLKGNLIVAVKDAKVKLFGGNELLSLNLTVKSVQVHKTGTNDTDNNITAAGWITISNDTREFDLLNYTGDVTAILGEKELDAGRYTQIRLYISSAIARISMWISGTTMIRNYNTTIPSNVLKLIHPFTVDANKTLVLTLDFDVENSVSRPEGIWTFKPTIKTITEEILEKGQKPEKSVLIPGS